MVWRVWMWLAVQEQAQWTYEKVFRSARGPRLGVASTGPEGLKLSLFLGMVHPWLGGSRLHFLASVQARGALDCLILTLIRPHPSCK